MPYRSEKQRRFMHAKHPGIARRWDEKYGGKVSKRQLTLSESEKLRRAKKFNVATSTASGLLGVGALGALGATRAPGVAARIGRGAKTAQKLQRAGNKATVPLSAASLGVGGVGSLNFARVQNQEANALRRRKNVRKNMDGNIGYVDFGLSSVRQGDARKVLQAPEDNEILQEFAEISKMSDRKLHDLRDMGMTTAGIGGATMVGASLLARRGGGATAGTQAMHVLRSTRKAGKMYARGVQNTARGGLHRSVGNAQRRLARQNLRNTLSGNRAGVAGLAGGAGWGGGLVTAGAAGHKRKVKKDLFGDVSKAYDPERNRMRRLDLYSHAAAAGAGVAGAAAAQQGYWAAGKGNPKQASNFRNKAGGQVFRRGVVRGHRAGALGLTAIGMGVGANKIQQYKRGRGRSWNPRELD